MNIKMVEFLVLFGSLTALMSMTGCPDTVAGNGSGDSGSGGGPGHEVMDCEAGEVGCSCLPNGSCGVAMNGEAMSCEDNVCVLAGCFAGIIGCACNHGVCDDGHPCVDGICEPCPVGTHGCGCYADGSCGGMLACIADTCVEEPSEVGEVPIHAICYSPCSAGLTTEDGTYVPCSSDGLMQGCYGNTVCENGSCVAAPGHPAPGCESDADCPDFQACISGGCYSNCEYDSDCVGGLSCYRHVCRLPCGANQESCPATQSCVTVDGEYGYCLPLGAPAEDETVPVLGDFAVDVTTFELSNIKTSGVFTITNNAPASSDFIVRKVEQVAFAQDGVTVIRRDDVMANPDAPGPLHWLRMGPEYETEVVNELVVRVDGDGGSIQIHFEDAANPVLARWDGVLEVFNESLGVRRITLRYNERPEGRWSGKMYFFANFPDGELQRWIDEGRQFEGSYDSQGNKTGIGVDEVDNAFIHRWAAFKSGMLLNGFDDFHAVLSATVNESWKWPLVQERCWADAACYLVDTPEGIATYSEDVNDKPIPTGATELPIALNLRVDRFAGDPAVLSGKIDTAESLHYGGEPEVRLTFESDPAAAQGDWGADSVVGIQSFEADIVVGGRYLETSGSPSCEDAGYVRVATPWLVPGFQAGTALDDKSGYRYRYECRDDTLPYNSGPGVEIINVSMAGSNPIPDGRARRRTLELVDGALINQNTLFIIFRERFESFLGTETEDADFSAYGYMLLRRSTGDLETDAFQGTVPEHDDAASRESQLGVPCDVELVQEIFGPETSLVSSLSASQINELAVALVEGVATDVDSAYELPLDGEEVHYFCEDTGLIDGGPGDNGTDTAVRIPCPVGSKVTYFTVTDKSQGEIADLDCQQGYTEARVAVSGSGRVMKKIASRGTCWETLALWRHQAAEGSGGHQIRFDPAWRCDTEGAVFCDNERYDLRDGKNFYAQATKEAVFVPLYAAVDNAFRYKTRFRSRTGGSIGFAPQICVPDSDQIPYCYDPAAIEKIRERVDCAVNLYVERYDELDPGTHGKRGPRQVLRDFLLDNFSFFTVHDPTQDIEIVYDGFERLFSELLIMMGDESFTRAFASRFDLAGGNIRSFEGELFEPGGINLSGGAGYEMYNLYQATQYYQATLDRFYQLSPLVWEAIALGPDKSFVTQATVVTYFDRLLRASTQKARAWSEIARRYQSFNRPELARFVIERAYTSTYLESIALSRINLQVAAITEIQNKDQIIKQIELGQHGYRAALLDMRELYQSITDEVTMFGFSPDYIPFPALDPSDINAFEKMLASAKQKMFVAANKETMALQQNRSYETDSAQFQSELARIRNNFENQLADLCGTFKGDDGRFYPAIPKYAYLNERTKLFGNPCGLVGNGQIFNAMVGIELAALGFEGVRSSHANTIREIEIERKRVSAQCGLIADLADFQWKTQGRVKTLKGLIRTSQVAIQAANRIMSKSQTMATLNKCVVGTADSCATAAAASAVYLGIEAANENVFAINQIAITAAEHQVEEISRAASRWTQLKKCDAAQIDSQARVHSMLLRLAQINLDALKADYQVRQAFAELSRLQNQATRFLAEQAETQQLTINVEAARNDPNVRIYKNDAIITADRTFKAALREVYKATLLYEYYTSQSYARLDNLFLVRMIVHGDISLETYVGQLEEAFYYFEEQFGNPDARVSVLSLRDDIFAVPRTSTNATALSHADRIEEFRRRLKDVTLLDANGYRTIQFSTSLGSLSPLTHNHKIRYVEAEVVGSDVGDTLGRLYLRQRGTGIVRTSELEKGYYAFPARTAVVNPFFNGVRAFSSEIYRNERLRDRPFVNTHWEIVLNQLDEQVNQDINLQSLTDVRLYVYYTDFTAL